MLAQAKGEQPREYEINRCAVIETGGNQFLQIVDSRSRRPHPRRRGEVLVHTACVRVRYAGQRRERIVAIGRRPRKPGIVIPDEFSAFLPESLIEYACGLLNPLL